MSIINRKSDKALPESSALLTNSEKTKQEIEIMFVKTYLTKTQRDERLISVAAEN